MDEQQEALRQYPCPVCGQSEFEFGQVVSRGGVNYVAGSPHFWNQPRDSWGSARVLMARACLHCWNIQTFVRKPKYLPVV